MLGIGLALYAFLLSFILLSDARNRRLGQDNPAILTATGYVLCGLSVGLAATLALSALYAPDSAAALLAAS